MGQVVMRSGVGESGLKVAAILGLDGDRLSKDLTIEIPTDSRAVAHVGIYLTADELRRITEVVADG